VSLVELSKDVIESSIGTERVDLSRLPKHISRLRTVLIGKDGAIDLCPCAGTHIRSLSELKGLRSITKRSKGADTTRIEYTLI
jgi:misacylated tRNA(Ala) deacylase